MQACAQQVFKDHATWPRCSSSKNRQDAELLTLDRAQGGVLEWPANIIDMVNKSGLGPRGATLAEKKLEMAAYLFELVYDLMIADRDNVSGNPGFEALIGYYGEDK